MMEKSQVLYKSSKGFKMSLAKKLGAFTLVATLGVSTLILAGCKHENPLLKNDPITTGRFLIHASRYAEKSLKPPRIEYKGGLYGYCMRGKKPRKFENMSCKEIYQYMLSYAKTQKPYKSLALQDLTDPKVWYDHTRDEYGILLYKGSVPFESAGSA